MRNASLVLLGVAAVLGVAALARAQDPPAADKTLEERMRLAEAQIEYLRAREASVSAYITANAQRAQGLDALAADMDRLGFGQKAIPAESRERLLQGIRALAASLRDGLPVLTEAEQRLLKQIQGLSR
jgi:hypothetical protein